MAMAGGRWTSDRGLIAILAIALVLRVALVAVNEITPAFDAADYQRIAVVLSETGAYPPTTYAEPGSPSAFRPPAYPYALAATKVVAGEGFTAGRLLGALLGTLSVLLVFLIARELWSRRIALVAAALAAAFPPLLFADTALLSEVLFTPCMLGMAWAALRAGRSPQARRWLLAAGALTGLAMLTRSSAVALLLPLAVAAWRTSRHDRRAAAGSVALALLAAAVVVAPWTIRNAIVFDAFVPVSTQSGYSLAATYNADAAQPGMYQGAARIPMELPELREIFAAPGQDEAELSDRLGEVGRQYAAEHPTYVLTVVWRNLARMWMLGGPSQSWRTRQSHAEMGVPAYLDGLLGLFVFGALVLALVGALRLLRRSAKAPEVRGPVWLWAIPVLLVGLTAVISGGPRYRVVVDPFVLMLAAVVVARWGGRRRRRAEDRPAPA